MESHWLGGEVRTRWELTPTNHATAGVEFTYHPHATQQNYDLGAGATYLHDHRDFDTWGVYLQDEWRLRPRLHLSAGVRFDSVYGRLHEWSPRIGLVWQPIADGSVKLLIGRAFRAPSLYDQFYVVDGVSLQNPRLRAEHMLSYELVFEQRLARGLAGVASLYRFDVDDVTNSAVVGRTAGGQVRYQKRNASDLEAMGAEAELRWALPYSAELRTSYALQRTWLDDRRASNSPQHLGAAQLWVPLPYGLGAGAEVLIVGSQRTDRATRVEAARIVNLTLRSPAWHGARLSASAYNLLDHEYPDPVAAADFRQDRIPQDGRTRRLQVELTF